MIHILAVTPNGMSYMSRPLSPDEDVHLREMEEHGVGCMALVVGSLVPPRLSITMGSIDMTHFFTPTPESQTIGSDGPFGVFRSQLSLTFVTMNPNRDFNGKPLICTAMMDGFPAVTSTATLAIECKFC